MEHHPRHGDVVAAVAARVNRHPATNAAEAGMQAVLVDLLLDRLQDARAKIPSVKSLTPEAVTAVLVFIDDMCEHVTLAQSHLAHSVSEIAQVIMAMEDDE